MADADDAIRSCKRPRKDSLIQVAGEEIIVPLTVLRQSDYFVARLDRWTEKDPRMVMDISLPDGCSAADVRGVMLCVERSKWIFQNAAAAMRAARVAAMLMLDSRHLEDLAQEVLKLVTDADADEVRQLLMTEPLAWPCAFAATLQASLRLPEVDADSLRQLIVHAVCTPTEQPRVSKILRVLEGHVAEAVAAAAEHSVRYHMSDADGLSWLFGKVAIHVDTIRASSIFVSITTCQRQRGHWHTLATGYIKPCWCGASSSLFSPAAASTVQDAFLAQLLRCIRCNHAEAEKVFATCLRSYGLPPKDRREGRDYGPCDLGPELGACCDSHPNVLFLGDWPGERLVALTIEPLRSIAQKGLINALSDSSANGVLHPPSDLAAAFQPELLRLLSPSQQCTLIDRLGYDELGRWATCKCLEALYWPAQVRAAEALVPALHRSVRRVTVDDYD
ncbi:unnamed protein product [Polarella glacialis]|uniref:BTB domain-containing protein n=1 Tax=Polarella glacialis TaxID=89957 RepID=A0A813I096_POLGL|nr:unnamed protein product [Polarella glacialis]